VISSPLLVTLALGALSASLALLMARLHLPVAADVFAMGGALLGVAAFVAAAVTTVRSARRLPSRRDRR
jgi:hypothetical protein